MRKIKLVVFNNHTLGYILPELPNRLQVLQASVLRGATFKVHDESIAIGLNDSYRLATAKDFADFNFHFGGFQNNPDYEHA
jgi:hypothetical protein